jgi:hypothetical protein
LTDFRPSLIIDQMAKYKTIGMLRSGLQKELNDATIGGGHAPYLDERERLPYLVTAYGGRLYQGGKPLDTTAIAVGTYLYVMDGVRVHQRLHGGAKISSEKALASAWRTARAALPQRAKE